MSDMVLHLLPFLALAMTGATQPPELRVSVAIPHYWDPFRNAEAFPRFLRRDDRQAHFAVTIENVSHRPLQVWTSGNSVGDYIFSFEISYPDGHAVTVKRRQHDYAKNILMAERLLPGEVSVRDIYYDQGPGEWVGFPQGANDKREIVKMRAVLTQAADPKRPEVWGGVVSSEPVSVQI